MTRRDGKKKKAAKDDETGGDVHNTGDDVTAVEDRRYVLTVEPDGAAAPDDSDADCY